MSRGGRPATSIGNQFTEDSGKFDCRWCRDWKRVNGGNKRRIEHLLSCKEFIQGLKDSIISIDDFAEPFRSQLVSVTGLAGAGNLGLATSATARGGLDRQAIDRLAAMAVYRGGLPFNVYQSNADLRGVFKALNPAMDYSPPTRARLAGELLTKCAGEIRSKIAEIVNFEQRLNVITDESGARDRDRVVNFAINTSDGQAFFIDSFNAGSVTVSGEWLQETITEKVRNLTGNNLKKWNSICTDTCAAQRNFHEALRSNPETAHVFCVLCDDHGLQLGIKDVCDPDQEGSVLFYASTIKEVNTALTFFRASDKIWHMMLELAAEENEKLVAFVIACTTRWGSHFEAVMGLLKNKSILQIASARGFVTKPEVKRLVDDERWWARVESLRALIKPFHFAQKLSENDRSTVGMVIPRWRELRDELEATLNLPHKDEVLELVDKRLAIQTTDIHHAAYLLNCQLDDPQQTKEEWIATARFCNSHVAPDRLHNFWRQFAEFTDRRGVFSRAELWTDSVRFQPQSFWMLASKFGASELADLAGRLATTPANSVPSERSFSAMNYIQNKFRARMSTPTTTDLCLIYINSRVLDRRNQLLSEEFRRQQITRRSQRLAARNDQRQIHRLMLEEVKRIDELNAASVEDLVEEVAAVIPATTTAAQSDVFIFATDTGEAGPAQSDQPTPSELPKWVVLPTTGHQSHLHLEPQHHPTKKQSMRKPAKKKRKIRHETPPETSRKTPPQTSENSAIPNPPSDTQFSIGDSAPSQLFTPSQTPRITSTMTTQEASQAYMQDPLAEFSQQSRLFNHCAQARDVYSVGSSYDETLEAIAMYNATQTLDDY
jgi:hypothetical protein